MLKNYFKIAVRNILRNKLYSFINIAGLAVGIACCLAILTFVRDEFSYDKFNKHADETYGAAFSVRVNGHGFSGPASPAPLGPQVAHDVPDVVSYTRFYLQGSQTVAHKNRAFSEEKFFWADSSIFDVFTIRVVEGNPKTALTQPNTMVINESTARKYFGGENPLGKVINVDKENDYSDIVGRKMSFDLFGDPLLIPVLIGFVVVVGIVAGIYPAFYLSSRRSVTALKSNATEGGRKSKLRNALVVSQFAVSIVLLIATFVIYSQMRYVRSANLGFQKAGLLVVNGADHLSGQFQSFMHELGGNKNVISLTNSSAIPVDLGGNHAYKLEGSAEEQPENTRVLVCDNDFAKTYQLTMAEGRVFSEEHPSDTGAVVVNEALVKIYGMKNMVGRRLLFPGPKGGKEWVPFEIIGVVKDFNYSWMHEPIRPLAIILPRSQEYVGSYVTARLAPGSEAKGIAAIGSAWKKYAGNEPLNYSFLDDGLRKLYSLDYKTEEIVGLFSALAIFIACLGLFGLAAFTTEQRTKEIGIRKVLGASVPEVTRLLSLQFAKWVLIANVFAWPLAYLLMNKWLSLFAYRMNMDLWIFIASGVLALIIALATVSSHAIKAATANPVEALRYE